MFKLVICGHKGSRNRSSGDVFDDYTNQIVVNLNHALNKKAEPIIVFNRWNKSSLFYYHPLAEDPKAKETDDCNGCPDPPFVKKMSQTLFSQIQGTVPLDDRYLILFNISNVMKYCMTGVTEVWHNFDFQFNLRHFTFSAMKITSSLSIPSAFRQPFQPKSHS